VHNFKKGVVVMTVKRIAALTLGLGLTITAGGAPKTVKAVAANVPLTSNGVRDYRATDNPDLLMKIYNTIITSKEFSKQADKSLAQRNIGILEKYLTQKLKEYKKLVSNRGLDEVKGYLISAIFQPMGCRSLATKNPDEMKRHLMCAAFSDKLPEGRKPVPLPNRPGKGPIGCWPPAT
jgi:hypothetical protein